MTAAMSHRPRQGAGGFDYDEAKRLARSDNEAERRRLAETRSMPPEILFYLAGDAAAEVRRAIAANPGTPRQADLLLATDHDQQVRECLAAKIARVLPDLSPREHDSIYRMTVQVLETLARDQATRVRAVLAEALKDMPEAPPEVIGRLARDIELDVAAPVLEFSPLLSEADLMEIIAAAPAVGAIGAIARRRRVSGDVADAIVAAGDAEAVAALLGNVSAQIREETLDRIVDQAPRQESWHEPLVRRPVLPGSMIRRIAGFVAESLLGVLRSRNDLDDRTIKALAKEVDRRLWSQVAAAEEDAPAKDATTAAEKTTKARAQAAAMHDKGKLDEDAVLRAVNSGDRAFAIAAFSVCSGIPEARIERLMALRSAKGIVSLVWKCGFTMRLAGQVQIEGLGKG
ncbi:MAG: DUF2336 domain-containing protein [Alphaproteobacteria bacterium]|nr:DUF2336 domain-containing protein [Alphaproteobacteria bacterium]